MKIHQKLTLGFFVPSLIVGITGFISWTTNIQILQDLSKFNQSSIKEAEVATEMAFTLQGIQMTAQEVGSEKLRVALKVDNMAKAGTSLEVAQKNIKEQRKVFKEELITAREATKTAIQLITGSSSLNRLEEAEIKKEKKQLVLLDEIQVKFFYYEKLVEQFISIATINPSNAERFSDVYLKEYYYKEIIPLIREYQKDAEQELTDEARHIKKYISDSNTTIFISIITTLLVSIILSLVISYSISKPIITLKNAAARMGKGELHTRVRINSGDEVEILANTINQMANNLSMITVSKSYVDNIIKSMVDTLIIVSPGAKIIMINQAALRLLGYEENELINTPIDRVCPEATRLIANDLVTIRKSFNSNNEISYLAKDGSRVPMSLSVSPMQDDTGTTQGIICVAQDITERKQGEEALLRASVAEAAKQSLEVEIVERKRVAEALLMSEKRLRKQNRVLVELARHETLSFGDIDAALKEITKAAALTLDVERVSVWLYNDDRSKIHCLNLYQQSINSYTEGAELSAVDYLAYFQASQVEQTIAAHDAQIDSRTKEFSEYLSALGITSMLDAPIWLGGRMVGVVCHEHKGATRQWALEEQNFAGSIAELVALAIEVCERKRAEEALRESQRRLATLIDSLPGIVFSCTTKDSQWSMNYLSEGCFALTEYTSEKLIGSGRDSYNTIIYTEDLAKVDQAIERAIATQEPYVVEYRIYTKSGQEKWLWEKGNGVFNSKGEVISLEGFITDITKRKQAEEEISSALEKEKELGELKSRFVTITSHEFRTPLSTILSSADILQRYYHKLTEEKKFHHLGCIQATVKNMTQLLNDVLLIGKAEAGKLECKPTPLELVQFCRNLIEEMQITTNTHTISFHQQGECSTVGMDEKLLRHILSNLLSNAIKYSPQGGIVNFDLICEQEKAIFRVQDRGIGIPTIDQANLFGSFHRANNVGTISGTGLGLAIVKKSVDLHGGNISVESEVGVGTTFIVTIPFHSPFLSLSVDNILQPL